MHIDHKAGEKLFVDYAGDKLAIVDPESGAAQPVETFVAILGASELTYVEAAPRNNVRTGSAPTKGRCATAAAASR